MSVNHQNHNDVVARLTALLSTDNVLDIF